MRSLFIASSLFWLLGVVVASTPRRARTFHATSPAMHSMQVNYAGDCAKAPHQNRRGASSFLPALYCFEPVVLLFGFGEQFRFCGFASFSQAAILAYLQFNPPLADVLIQNGEDPIV